MLFRKKTGEKKKSKKEKELEEDIAYLTKTALKKDLYYLEVPLAYARIKELSGEPTYSEIHKTERFTFAQSIDFFKKRYGAKEVTVDESLNYLPDGNEWINEGKSAEDPVKFLTYNDLSKDKVTTLVLPITNGNDDNNLTAKNSLVLYLEQNNGVLVQVWISPVKTDFDDQLEMECVVLTNSRSGYYLRYY